MEKPPLRFCTWKGFNALTQKIIAQKNLYKKGSVKALPYKNFRVRVFIFKKLERRSD